MMRSMFSGVAGLQAQQTAMDVIGNNIANVNTAGYKDAQVNFQDILSQTLQGASAAQGNRGGTNPMQVGLGVKVSSITTVFTPGSFQSTGVNTNLAINDDGFFVVSNGSDQLYTRAGAFIYDSVGNLVDPGTGYQVQGWMRNPVTGLIDTNAPTTNITVPKGVTMAPKVSTEQLFTGNLSAADVEGSSTQTSGKVYDSLGNAHTSYTTYYKMDDKSDTWLANVKVPDLGVENNYQLSFDSAGKFSNLVSITPNAAPSTTTTLTLAATMQMDATNVKTTNFTVADASGNIHSLQAQFTPTVPGATGAGSTWSYTVTDTTAGGSVLAVSPGTLTWNGTTYTGFGPFTVAGNAVAVTAPAAAVAPVIGSFSATAAPTPVITGQNIPKFQMDTSNTQHQEYTVFDGSKKMHVIQATFTPASPGSSTVPISWNYTFTDKSDSTVNIPGGTITWNGVSYSGFPSSIPVGPTSLLFNAPAASFAPSTGTFQASATQPFTTLATASTLALNPAGANAMSVTVDMGALTQYQSADNAIPPTTDGYAAGTLKDTTFDSSGTIVGSFDNGMTMNLGQIALATFNNSSGLTKVANTMFAVSNNSGAANVGTAATGGRGTVSASELEQSNVDLAQEFSNMIITERAFQANSKIITTSDEMLQTLTDLKR